MFETAFRTTVRPLDDAEIAYCRTCMRSGDLPMSPMRISPAQGLLFLSLTCRAGARPAELSRMRVETLFERPGEPNRYVRFTPETTKHRRTRRVEMHGEVRSDLLMFTRSFPKATWVARASDEAGNELQRPLSEHALTTWVRAFFRHAGIPDATNNSARKAFLISKREG